jgi:CHC2-type zinc finger protein
MTRKEIVSANPIVDFVRSHGHELWQAGKNFVTDGCPVCKHKKRGHRPVTLYTQTQSWNCHDCKRGGSVIDWVMHERGCDAADAMRLLGGGRNGSEPEAMLVKTYDYVDENGKLLSQTCRYEPKNFKQRQRGGKGGWTWNLQGVRRVLYRLPVVITAQTVCIAEGERMRTICAHWDS